MNTSPPQPPPPSPKQVYAAFGSTYVGYIPLAGRLVALNNNLLYGVPAGKLINLSTLRYIDYPPITLFDSQCINFRSMGYTCDVKAVYVASRIPSITEGYASSKQPRWQLFLFDALREYSKYHDNNSFYVFEDFIIGVSSGDTMFTLLWAKYAKTARWRPLDSLDDLLELKV